jgi:hypothetical protein
MKVYSDNNVTVHTRMRSDDGLETAWVPLENVRDLSSVRWLQETPLDTITVEHRVIFANGTSSESQTRLNSSSTARDWVGGDFSRTLLWDGWDTFWVVVAVIVVAAVVVAAVIYFPAIAAAVRGGIMAFAGTTAVSTEVSRAEVKSLQFSEQDGAKEVFSIIKSPEEEGILRFLKHDADEEVSSITKSSEDSFLTEGDEFLKFGEKEKGGPSGIEKEIPS